MGLLPGSRPGPLALLARNQAGTICAARIKGRRGWLAFAGHDEYRFHPAWVRSQAGMELAMTVHVFALPS
jgi:hypothetical protein